MKEKKVVDYDEESKEWDIIDGGDVVEDEENVVDDVEKEKSLAKSTSDSSTHYGSGKIEPVDLTREAMPKEDHTHKGGSVGTCVDCKNTTIDLNSLKKKALEMK